jgi:hypothetical protein
MLSKRIFWLALAAAVGWLIWMRLRQRQEEFAAATPQFAAPRTFEPAVQPAPAPQPAPPAVAAEAPAAPPEAAVVAAEAPAAPPEPAAVAAADSEAGGARQEEISGYCMRCRTKRPIQNPRHETTESGRPAARGTCPVCGANMFTFLATNDNE